MSNGEHGSVEHIVANPETYGFSWYHDKVSKGDATWTVPLVKHEDVDLLREAFGDRFFLDSADGTSRHVTNQRIARDMKNENATATDVAIKRAIVESMLGMKARRRTVVQETVYEFGGVKYANREERDAAARRELTAEGYPPEMVEKFVARLSSSKV